MATGNPTANEVTLATEKLGRELTPGQAFGLAVYLGLLEAWNRKTNLVGPRAWPEMLSELVADSWHLADCLDSLHQPHDPLVLDFGAGAGIPGVPLRLFWTRGRYVLIEPRAKRAGFLRQCAAMMRLPRTEVFEGRAEAFAEKADICLSRAFQPWPEFLGTARGHLKEPVKPDAGESAAVPGDAGGVTGRGSSPASPRVIVFAKSATPEQNIPHGFELEGVSAYPARGGRAYFWVFAPRS